MTSFSVSALTWNVQSISISKKSIVSSFNSPKFLTLKHLSLSKIELIALQELNCNINVLKNRAKFSLPNKKVLFSCSEINNFESLALYYDSEFKLVDFTELRKGRLLKVLLEKAGQSFAVYTIYNYTSAQLNSSYELLNILSNDILTINNNIPILVLGDFNINLSKDTRASFFLKNLMSDLDLIDTADWFSSPLPTWKGDGNRVSSESRLDLILTKNFDLSLFQFNLLPTATSDHAIVLLEKKFSKPKISPHMYSHINESLLDNPSFRELFFSNLILLLKKFFLFHNASQLEKDFFLKIDENRIHKDDFEFLDNPEFFTSDDIIDLFHEIFLFLANQTHQLHKKIKSQKNKQFNRFKKAFFNLQKFSDPHSQNDYLSAKSDLKDLINKIQASRNEKKRIKKLQTASQTSSDVFYILGKKSGRNVARIRDPSTGLITDCPERIVQIFSSHYRSKTEDFSNSGPDPPVSFPNIFHDLLSEFDTNINEIFSPCVGETFSHPFAPCEIRSVLKEFKNKVATGPSKLSKFSMQLIMKFIPSLFAEYLNILANKNLSSDPRTSWISKRNVIFIKKKNSDVLDVGSYRPISLLETLYKLIAKLAIKRFENEIFSRVSISQFGFRRGKQMSLASLSLIQILNSLQSKDFPAAMISIDIKAAFDTIKHSTLNASLKHLFPDNPLIDIIFRLSHNPTANVCMGGHLGEDIQISKGCGQGCPSSTFKYVVIHHVFNFFLEKFMEKELLAIPKRIIHNSLPDIPQENTGFADDTMQLVQNLNSEKASKLLTLYEKLQLLTGLQINPAKSTYLAIGPVSAEFKSALSMLATERSSIEHLGVILSPDFHRAQSESYQKVEKAMKTRSAQIVACIGSVDVFTRISLTRTLILSKPQHIFRVYAPDKKTLASIWDVFRNTLWSKNFNEKISKRTKVAKCRLTLPVQSGGLNILHIQTTAAISVFSSFVSVMAHAFTDRNSILSAVLHSNVDRFDTAVQFLNPHYFRTFWSSKIRKIFPHSGHLTDHLQDLFDELELDEFFGFFMPVLHHKLMDSKVKFLNVFKPSDFECGKELSPFHNIVSLMDVCHVGRLRKLVPERYNSDIDKLTNPHHKKYLIELHSKVTKTIKFHANRFALRNKNLSLMDLVSKYSTSFLTGALKKAARKLSSKNNPPPLMDIQKKRRFHFPSLRPISKFICNYIKHQNSTVHEIFSLRILVTCSPVPYKACAI